MTAEPSVDDEVGQTTPTQHHHQNLSVQGRVPAKMASAVNAVAAGRRASSPSPRPGSPANSPFLSSSPQLSGLESTSQNDKTADRFSDAFTSLAGRNRALSSVSNSQDSTPTKFIALEDSVKGSSFGIDADPFASHYNASAIHDSQDTQLAVDQSPSPPTPSNVNNTSSRRHRGSLLFAASDALGFGRVGASISRRMGRCNSGDQTPLPLKSQTQPQQRKGLPWKGRTKSKGHWALQPSSSTHIISDVIEISAAKAGSISVRDEEEENERRERERLREAAAESIGISPLFREGSSSRLAGSDSVRFEDDSFEDGSMEIRASLEDDLAERMRNLDRSRTSISGSTKSNGFPGLQLQTRETRHHRSSSVSGLVTPATPSSANWPLPPLGGPPLLTGNANGRTQTASLSTSVVQAQLPAFPCLFSALDPFTRKASPLLKHFPSSPLHLPGFSRQWRTRFIVMTSPPQPRSPSVNGFRPFATSERTPSVCHLHLFKTSASDEREIERLEVNENSVVFVAEDEVAGKRSVVKVGGMDVGGKRKELNVEENGQTMWFLTIADANEAQSWITTLKSAVLDQRAEKAGFGMPTHSTTTTGPRGDLDVMLSMRAQDVASAVRSYAQADPTSSSPLLERIRARDTASPTPTVRSWTGDGKPASLPGRMVNLKGLFSVPGRTRSLSQGTTRSDDSPTSPEEPTSFTSRGTKLLNMIRTSSGNSASGAADTDSRSVPMSSTAAIHTMPGPILSPVPILSTIDVNLDKAGEKERDRELPEWYSIQSRQYNRVDSASWLNASPALLPPPRSRRPWTSAGLLTNSKQEKQADSTFPPRKTFQDNVSLGDGRLSVDEMRRSHSPVDSLGTATGVFGTPELGSRRASQSSSISSFLSSPADRDQHVGRPNSAVQRRIRAGKIPKMLTPPAGPPPSVPASQSQPLQSARSNSTDRDTVTSSVGDRTPSRSSSIRSTNNSDVMQNGTMPTGRRLSTSSALSVGSANTSQSLTTNLNSVRQASLSAMPPKRSSMPPPPRPAPTFALPPTPAQASLPKENGAPPRRSSFRESFSHRSLRFSLTQPPTKGISTRRDDPALRRRSLSSGGSVSSIPSLHAPSITSITGPPPVPPPTGPLPPTPQDIPASNRYSFRERLRMKSAPSTLPPGMLRGAAGPPSSFPGSPPLVTVSSVASLKDARHSVPIGEPITVIPKDLNFLNMSSPIEATEPTSDDVDFLNMSSPLITSFPKQIPPRSSGSPPPEHGSPPSSEMTVLPPPPRRSRNGTISEKDRDRSSQSLSSAAASAAMDGFMSSLSVGTVATV